MKIWNLYTCKECKRQVIAEEKNTHRCLPLKKHVIEDKTLWVYDGHKWYPLKIGGHRTTQKKTGH